MAFLIKVAIAGKNDNDYKYFDNVFQNYVGSHKQASVKNLTAAILGQKVDAVIFNPDDEANKTYVDDWSSTWGFIRNTLHQFNIVAEDEFPEDFFDAIKQVSPEAIIRYFCITDSSCFTNLPKTNPHFRKLCLPGPKALKSSVDEAIRDLCSRRGVTNHEIWLVQSVEDYPTEGLINSRIKYIWSPEKEYDDLDLEADDKLLAKYKALIGPSIPQDEAVVNPSGRGEESKTEDKPRKTMTQPQSGNKADPTNDRPLNAKSTKSKSCLHPILVFAGVIALLIMLTMLFGGSESDEEASGLEKNSIENVIDEFNVGQQIFRTTLRLKGSADGKDVQFKLDVDDEGTTKGTMTIAGSRSCNVEGVLDSTGTMTLTEKRSDGSTEILILLERSNGTITGTCMLDMPGSGLAECDLIEY